jgi:hypothetical protein
MDLLVLYRVQSARLEENAPRRVLQPGCIGDDVLEKLSKRECQYSREARVHPATHLAAFDMASTVVIPDCRVERDEVLKRDLDHKVMHLA